MWPPDPLAVLAQRTGGQAGPHRLISGGFQRVGVLSRNRCDDGEMLGCPAHGRQGDPLVTFRPILSAATIAALAHVAFADGYADTVVSYDPGALTNPIFNDPAAALGGLNPDTGFGLLTPFNPPFATTDLVEVGTGGSLTLALATPAATTGYTLGIHAGVGLVDQDGDLTNNDAFTGDPVYTFDTDPLFGGLPRRATVSVSFDGVDFVSLGSVDFLLPSNVDAASTMNAPASPINDPADPFQPFVADLQDFANRNYAGVLDVLDGSAGGTWLDLSGVALPAVNFVRFDVDASGDERFFIDAVVSVPEPSSAALLAVSGLLLRRRR